MLFNFRDYQPFKFTAIKVSSLDATIINLKQKEESLLLQTQDLDLKVKLKGALQTEIVDLQSQKNELEGTIAKIYARYSQIHNIVKTLEADQKSLSDQVNDLKTTIADKQALDQSLTQTIDTKEKKVADLNELESKRAKIAAEVVNFDAQYKVKKEHLAVLEAF